MVSFSHTPILVDAVVAALAPRPGGRYCDATLGGGGHSEALLEACGPDGRVVGLDRDPAATAAARRRLERFGDRFVAVQTTFDAMPQVLADLGWGKVDGVLADLGVSSPQLDEADRGFSFQRRGPIDMRMNPTEGQTALDLIATCSEEDLAWVLRQYGDEKFSKSIARALKQALAAGMLTSTLALAEVVRGAVRIHDAGQDAATRTFQALRMAVNDELGQLHRLLTGLPQCLADGGRAVFLCFQSLEDRMIKQAWGASEVKSHWRVLTPKPVYASEDEVQSNPRSRAARLRAAVWSAETAGAKT